MRVQRPYRPIELGNEQQGLVSFNKCRESSPQRGAERRPADCARSSAIRYRG